MTFESDELAATIRRPRKRRRVDGRAIRGVTQALENALTDEARDSRILDLVNQGKTYQKIGAEFGVSRQRATYLAERAAARKLMLIEYRAGADPKSLARHWRDAYPRKNRGQGSKEA